MARSNQPAGNQADAEYRAWLVKAHHKASEAYDKAIMTLAGGALGVSFAFIRDLVAKPAPATIGVLRYAWTALATSILCILLSMLTSQYALRKAIAQVDAERIRQEHPGGWYAQFTTSLTLLAGVLFVLGVLLLVQFAVLNLRVMANS